MTSRRQLICLLATLICLLVGSCNEHSDDFSKSKTYNTSKDESDILKLYENWATAVENGDRQQYVNLLDESVVLIAPGAPDIVGRENYAKFLSPVFENATYKIEPQGKFDIELLGDFALVRYDYIVNIVIKDGVDTITNSDAALTQLTNNSKYLDVLKRQNSGEWKVFRHMWNEGTKR